MIMKIAKHQRGPIVTWNDIKSSFPGIHCPEEAIRRTAKACVKLGLIKLNDTPELTDADIERLRKRQMDKRLRKVTA